VLLKLDSLLASMQQQKISTIDLTGNVIEDHSERRKLTLNRHVWASGHAHAIHQLEVLNDGMVVTQDARGNYKMWDVSGINFHQEVPISQKRLPSIQQFLQSLWGITNADNWHANFQRAYSNYQAVTKVTLPNSIGTVEIINNETLTGSLQSQTLTLDIFSSGKPPITIASASSIRLAPSSGGVVAMFSDYYQKLSLILIYANGEYCTVSDNNSAPTGDMLSIIFLPNNHAMAVYRRNEQYARLCELKLINARGKWRNVVAAPPAGYFVNNIGSLTLLPDGRIAAGYFYSNGQVEIKLLNTMGICQQSILVQPPAGYTMKDLKLTALDMGAVVICQYHHAEQRDYQYELLLIGKDGARVKKLSLLFSSFPTLVVHNQQYLVYAQGDNLFVVNLLDGTLQCMFEEHFDGICKIKLLSDICLASMSNDKVLKVWNLETRQCLYTCEDVTQVIFPQAGQLLVASDKDMILYNCMAFRPISAKDLQPLFEMLATDVTIDTCNFCGIALGDEGALQIANVLRTNRHILRLDLSKTGMTDIGAKQVLSALKANGFVEVLKLDENLISQALITSINARLEKHKATAIERTTLIKQKEEVIELPKEIEIPADLRCSITHLLMRDPVIAADGETYEREAIVGWLVKHDSSPITNLPLEHRNLVSNNRIRSQISTFLDSNPEMKGSDELYFQQSMQQQCLSAIQNQNYPEVGELIQKEPRLVTKPWKDKPNLLEIAARNSINLLNTLLKILGSRLKELPEISKDQGVSLFCVSAECLGVEGAIMISQVLNWNLADYEDQLFAAIRLNQAKVVTACLDLGVSLETVNTEGQTPLVSAKGNRHNDIVELLKSRDAKSIPVAPKTTMASMPGPIQWDVPILEQNLLFPELSTNESTLSPLQLQTLLQLVYCQSVTIIEQQKKLAQLEGQIKALQKMELLRESSSAENSDLARLTAQFTSLFSQTKSPNISHATDSEVDTQSIVKPVKSCKGNGLDCV
jgi:WD40 repeat protein